MFLSFLSHFSSHSSRFSQGQINLEPPTPAQAMAAMATNLMPRYGSYRYVAKGRRSVVIFDSASMEPGARLRAVYVVSTHKTTI